MTTFAEEILESKPIQITGKTTFVIAFAGTAVNYISQMEIIQPTILVISGILGIIFAAYKVVHVRIQIIETNEKRIAEGKKPITLKFWKWKKLNSKK